MSGMRLTEEQFAALQSRRFTRDKAETDPTPPKAQTRSIIRQSSGGPNKTEIRFYNERIKPMLHTGEIDLAGEHESINLTIGNGVRFRPDWPTWRGDRLIMWEVKGGFIREDAIVKLKAAARVFPRIQFYLCQWTGGVWVIQEVLS